MARARKVAKPTPTTVNGWARWHPEIGYQQSTAFKGPQMWDRAAGKSKGWVSIPVVLIPHGAIAAITKGASRNRNSQWNGLLRQLGVKLTKKARR